MKNYLKKTSSEQPEQQQLEIQPENHQDYIKNYNQEYNLEISKNDTDWTSS